MPELFAEPIREDGDESAQQRLTTAIAHAADSVVITDTVGTIEYVNAAFERSSGYSRAEAIGQNARLLKSGRHEASFFRHMWETLARGDVWTGHLVNRRKDGVLFEEDATIAPVRDDAGHIVSYVAVKRDVLRTAAIEMEMRQAQKMQAVGTLAAGIAHDFNNLLTAIFGHTNLAKNALPGGHPAIQSLELVEEAAQQASGVIRSLLTFSRKSPITKTPIHLGRAVSESIRLLRRVLPAAIQIVDEVSDAPDLWVRGDATQIQQVVMNIALNARDAMPLGGKLRITLARAARPQGETDVCLSVGTATLVFEDTGVGMPDEVRARAFEPFFTTKPDGRGAGLGLAVAHGIVSDHRGTIAIDSTLGRGTRFTLTLPCCPPPDAAPQKSSDNGARRGRGELLLVVTDNAFVRSMLASMLRSRGYDVVQAADAAAGADALHAHQPNVRLVIADAEAGGPTGLEHLRARAASVPLIVMTDGPTDPNGPTPRPRENLLRKPFQMSELTALVGRTLAGTRAERGPAG